MTKIDVTHPKFVLTEAEWFQLQLRMSAMEHRGESLSYSFRFPTEHNSKFYDFAGADFICMVCDQPAQQFLESKLGTDEQLEYYRGWVGIAKTIIEEALEHVPRLRGEFDIEKRVKFIISYSYGMGGAYVCEIYGTHVKWLLPQS